MVKQLKLTVVVFLPLPAGGILPRGRVGNAFLHTVQAVVVAVALATGLVVPRLQ